MGQRKRTSENEGAGRRVALGSGLVLDDLGFRNKGRSWLYETHENEEAKVFKYPEIMESSVKKQARESRR